MAIAPFRPAPSEKASEPHRTRLALAAATLGIAAALLAYAISPGVRHAVSHAEHTVRHAMGVFDRDHGERAKHAKTATPPGQPTRTSTKKTSTSSSKPAAVSYGAAHRR